MTSPGLTPENADAMQQWFDDYVQQFDLHDEVWQQNIRLKEQHSKRVATEIRHIGHCLNLSDEVLRFAGILGLFHDIGRFEQYARYKTFLDSQSENHAELGARILKEKKILEGLDDTAQQTLLRGVRYHNRAMLPEDESGEMLFFARLLRDADKLDIYRVLTGYYHRSEIQRNNAIELNLPDTEGFSETVYEDLMQQRIVNVKHIQNLNDFKLMQVGWVFDINFDPTFRAIQERGYLPLLEKALPPTIEMQQLFSAIQHYLDQKLRDTVH